MSITHSGKIELKIKKGINDNQVKWIINFIIKINNKFHNKNKFHKL